MAKGLGGGGTKWGALMQNEGVECLKRGIRLRGPQAFKVYVAKLLIFGAVKMHVKAIGPQHT